MPVYPCPKGHESSEPDFCSECGAKIFGDPATALRPVQPHRGTTGRVCPECGADQSSDDGVFCEVCGYNFSTGASGGIPGLIPQTPTAPSQAPPQPQAQETSKAWQLVIVHDASLRGPESPEPPADVQPAVIKLEKDINLIGRMSESRAIHPEIPLNLDDAVSHRHALLSKSASGEFVLRDIGSSNGTRLNGVELEPFTDHALSAGDQITLGHFTRITIQAVS
jgi:hypothetical protein